MNNTLSKEEVLNNRLTHLGIKEYPAQYRYGGYDYANVIEPAMDEYAKQEAIAFNKWVGEQYLDLSYMDGYDGEDKFIGKVITTYPPIRYTIEQLYDTYLLHKQNQ